VIGLRLAAERLGVRHVTTLVQPEPVRPPPDDEFSVYFNGLFGRLFDQQRRAAGLEPALLPFRQWLDQGRLAATLFPPWFCVPGIDQPHDEQTVMLDFLFDDPVVGANTPAAVDVFLATHDAPLVFTFGTGNRYVRDHLALAVTTAQALDRPAILLTRERDQLPGDLPRGIFHLDYMPLVDLLPYASAIVHHGGIGTSAQALRAGIPQLVIPSGFDQFDNAARTVAFGVGEQLFQQQLVDDVLARALDNVLRSPRVARQCAQMRRRFDPTHTVAWCCDAIEALC
jgi:UDP:flavonoid glycosyltransferase YjiC (YdhE family)